ncbi:MAG: hypothetical protein QOK29_4420 [Rhodospirillaceae bacterium]|jgi:uncharacterized membrane protein (DUF373 family)|nr:hypothetical protein [Rhodospirillaceae bacterium]
MALGEESAAAHQRWRSLSIYQKFEYVVVLILIGLIAIIVLLALWSLALKVLSSVVAATTFDPTDHAVFQSVFGMIFTVIIALEFKRSLLLVTARQETVVQVRAVILIAMLAIVRKLIILDVATTNAAQLFGLAAAILSLGGVYWLVRDQDRRGCP